MVETRPIEGHGRTFSGISGKYLLLWRPQVRSQGLTAPLIDPKSGLWFRIMNI